jgi:group II intron reverse transcriptase/maturase
MNERGKSDGSVVPEKSPNKESGAPSSAEEMEGRDSAKGNPSQPTRSRTQSRTSLQQVLTRVRQAAQKDRGLRLNALWHHVYDIDRLREAYFGLERKSAPGVDGETWQHYREELEGNLQDLSERLKRGAYRAKPVRRAFVPKDDGRKRPIGVPVLEDKIVQRSAAEVIGDVFEADFKGFSYGFRPGRSQHNALDAVVVGIKRKKIGWILDADIRGFFDTIDHGWLMKFVEHRIADRRVHRHVMKWLKAGVLEDGKRTVAREGTPQGGGISPLLANIYLHYVFDVWADTWRRKRAQGDVIIVRFADDFIVGFQHQSDAEQFQKDLTERFRRFNLELHPDKTRLIRFGRFAAEDRQRRGEGKPETFDFLGFTHICGKTSRGAFQVVRHTMRKRLRNKLRAVKAELRRRMHDPIPEVGCWLKSVVEGHANYYGVPNNGAAVVAFRDQVKLLWHRALSKRSQRGHVPWRQMFRLAQHWLPFPRIRHPWPEERLCVIT